MRVTARGLAAVLASVLFVSACGGPPVDLKQGLQIDIVATGWYDAGIVDGKNKLVPSITFKLKNVSDQKLPMLQVNGYGNGRHPVKVFSQQIDLFRDFLLGTLAQMPMPGRNRRLHAASPEV